MSRCSAQSSWHWFPYSFSSDFHSFNQSCEEYHWLIQSHSQDYCSTKFFFFLILFAQACIVWRNQHEVKMVYIPVPGLACFLFVFSLQHLCAYKTNMSIKHSWTSWYPVATFHMSPCIRPCRLLQITVQSVEALSLSFYMNVVIEKCTTSTVPMITEVCFGYVLSGDLPSSDTFNKCLLTLTCVQLWCVGTLSGMYWTLLVFPSFRASTLFVFQIFSKT